MTKMSVISSVSKNYSKAFFDVFNDIESKKKAYTELVEVREVIDSSDDLRVILDNTSISSKTKKDILDKIFCNRVNVNLLNFLKLLVEKNRFCEFESICLYYKELLDRDLNIVNVTVISALNLEDSVKDRISDVLSKKFNADVNVIWQIDSSIIAGLKVKVGDSVIDSSVDTKLKNLCRNVLKG